MSTKKTPFRLPRPLQSPQNRQVRRLRRALTACVLVGALGVGLFGGATRTFAQTYYYPPATTYYYSTTPVYVEPPVYVAPPKTVYVYPTYAVPAPPPAPFDPPLQVWFP